MTTMRPEQLQQLAGGRPKRNIPIELKKLDHKDILTARHLSNLICFAKTIGYVAERDYVSADRKKALDNFAREQAEYEQRLADVKTKINEAGKERIHQKMFVIDLETGKEYRKWSKTIKYREKEHGKTKFTVEITPDEFFSLHFSDTTSTFDANPITDKHAFDRELFEKWHEYEYSQSFTDKAGRSHTFRLKLMWRV